MEINTLQRPVAKPRNSIATSLSGTVGNTPLLTLQNVQELLPPSVSLNLKAEWFNPGGSVKDRPALAIIHEGLARGELSDNRTLLDSTSGNMGIAYAILGAHLGIRVHLAIPSNASPERISILQALGATLTLTDPSEGSDGARKVAFEMAAKHPKRFYYADQYDSEANWQAHYKTTGPEIFSQTEGAVTHFIAGLGTSGSLMGTGRYLKARLPEMKILGVQPASPLHGLEGLKHYPTSAVPGIYDPALPDQTLNVHTEEAYEMTRRLAREEGLFCGVSSGAAVHAAIRYGQQLEQATIVVLLPDSGLKYLSESFWVAPK